LWSTICALIGLFISTTTPSLVPQVMMYFGWAILILLGFFFQKLIMRVQVPVPIKEDAILHEVKNTETAIQ